MTTKPLRLLFGLCICTILYFNVYLIPNINLKLKPTLKHNKLRTVSSWVPPKNVKEFKDCDVPCYYDSNIPLVGRKVVFDDKGRSSTFMHTMEGPKHYPKSTYKGHFDGLSTVSMNSDVPLPYFSWAEYNIMSEPIDYDNAIKGSVFIARNCRSLNKREKLVTELQKYTHVDSVSSCVNSAPWPSHIPRTEKHLVMKKYLFYFAFENECSDDYMTEKLWGALEAGTLPVYYGAPNVLKYVPTNSIIDVHQFVDKGTRTIDYQKLGTLLNEIASDKSKYMKYHEWRFNSDYPSKFKQTYDFTHVHNICRSCRWNIARHDPDKYSFDHKTQEITILR